ncbi:MAG: TonB-dependent receptor [Candidatus Marinimicrobia bacterium]|nr:TonB-dependent receptor [Candidatus Neomarinimicrobiota bacterium]
MKLFYSSLVLMICVSSSVFAQSHISGTVTNASSGEPLPGANIVVVNTDLGSAANMDGSYTITLSPGEYQLSASVIGYETQTHSVLIDKQNLILNFSLNIEAVYLDENIVVTASRKAEKILESPSSITVLNQRVLEKDVVTNAVSSLRNIPGAEVVQTGLANYQVALRGFNSNFISPTYALVDYRHAALVGFSFNPFAAMPIDPIDLDRIEVIRGPASALYGAGVETGVIHFLTRDPFRYPGTSMSLRFGERESAAVTLRHAKILNDRLAFKIVTSFGTASDWELDSTDVLDKVHLDSYVDSIFSGVTDEFMFSTNGKRDSEVEYGYITGSLHYKLPNRGMIISNSGYSTLKTVFLTNQGEGQSDGPGVAFTQLRYQRDKFFAQVFFNQMINDEKIYLLRNGSSSYSMSTQFDGQIQQNIDLMQGKTSLTMGVDFSQLSPRSKGTVFGRNEENDTVKEIGSYFQAEYHISPTVDAFVAGRADYHSVFNRVEFSPRLALVWLTSPLHSLRLTANRAINFGDPVYFFTDIVVQESDLFKVRVRGSTEAWTYDDPTQITSLFNGERSDEIGIPYSTAYEFTVNRLLELGWISFEAQSFLLSRADQVMGFAEGSLVYPDLTCVECVENDRQVNKLPNREPLKPTVTNSIELGFKGPIAKGIMANVDLYYVRRDHFLSDAQLLTPLVRIGAITTDLLAAATSVVTDTELRQYGLDMFRFSNLFASAGTQLDSNFVAIAETNENYDENTPPEIMLSFVNFGKVDYYGIDVGIKFMLNKNVFGFANFSWISDDYFTDEDLGEKGTGQALSMNGPKLKYALGINYTSQHMLSLNCAYRYKDKFETLAGLFTGSVPESHIVDIGMGLDFDRYVTGLQLNITAQNVLGEKYRSWYGTPPIGRMIMGRLIYSF